jgi:polyisoprenoid-binding protein YceI
MGDFHKRGDSMDAREQWRVDAERSTLRFTIPHAILGAVDGQFHCWGGLVRLDPLDRGRSVVRIWVDLSSIDTGSARRDESLLDTELFDVRWEPGLVFDSQQMALVDAHHAVLLGQLALRCLSKQIVVVVEAKALWRGVDGSDRRSFIARSSIERSAFGLRRSGHLPDWLSDHILGDRVDIDAYVEAVREGLAAGDLLTGPGAGAPVKPMPGALPLMLGRAAAL